MSPEVREHDVRRFVTRGTGSQVDADESLKDLIDTLLARLSALRAGYLDNLANSGLLSVGKFHPKLYYAAFTKSPPVQNDWYTLLDTTEDVWIIQISARQTNDETDAKAIETEWTLDETDYGRSQNLNNNTTYYFHISGYSEQLIAGTSQYLAGRYTFLPAQSGKLRLRLTDAAGTNQTFRAYLWYAKKEAT